LYTYILYAICLCVSNTDYVDSSKLERTKRKNTEALVLASKETGLEVNGEKTKYMVMSRDQNVGQNINIQIGNKSFETVQEFKYLGTTTDQNSIHEEIKTRLNSGNACYHYVLNPMSSILLSKNVKIRINRTVILFVASL
jgi:hypothetical protein